MKKITALSILLITLIIGACLDDTADVDNTEEPVLEMLTYSLMLPSGEKSCILCQ